LGALLDGFTNLPPALLWGNFLFCILCTIAILRYHLLDIRIALRKGTTYILTSTIVAVPYVSVIILVTQVFKPQAIPFWVYLILLIILALILRPAWSWSQRLVDRWFYRERYDFLKALQKLGQETHSVVNLDELSLSFVRLVSQALQTSGCYLLLFSPLTGDFGLQYSIRIDNPVPQLNLSNRSPLIQYLRHNDVIVHNRDLEVIPQLQVITAQEKKELAEIVGKLYVPLKSREELVGVLILEEKLSQQLYSREEEGLLMTIANQMAISLENARLYDLEKEARSRLEVLHEQRNAFILAISHELKTPLTSIMLSSEMLSEEMQLSPKSPQHKLLKNLRFSVNSMEKRVKDLVDFLKLQSFSLEFEPNLENVKTVLKDIVDSISPLISTKKQTFVTEIPGSLPPVMIDRQRFGQILLNLLSNANRYTPTGGKIGLKVKVTDTELVVAVSDNGPGIPLDEQASVFKPYYRVAKRSDYSMGLGLSIAKSLVELHGGTIWLDSQPGKGSIFFFSIPVEGSRTREKELSFIGH